MLGLRATLRGGLQGCSSTEGFQVPSRGASEGASLRGPRYFERGLEGGYLKEALQGTFRKLARLKAGYLKSP